MGKILVIGAGKMGRAIAEKLNERGNSVILTDYLDLNHSRKNKLSKNIPFFKLQFGLSISRPFLDSDSYEEINKKFCLEHNVTTIVGAASYHINEHTTKFCIENGINFCDLGGNNTVVKNQLALNDQAKAKNITIIPDCGLAPGLAGWLAYDYIIKNKPNSVNIYVGGLPLKKAHLGYNLPFSAEGLINEYLEDVDVVINGEVKQVPALNSIKKLYTCGKTFTYSQTSGGLSTLPDSLSGKINWLSYNTLRYNDNHFAFFKTLKDNGMFGKARAHTTNAIEAMFEGESKDDVVYLSVFDGDKEVITLVDKCAEHSAMARCTGYPTAIVAEMLNNGEMKERGVLPGELVLDFDVFLPRLKECGIMVNFNKGL